MKKTKTYPRVRFSVATVKEAFAAFNQLVADNEGTVGEAAVDYGELTIDKGAESWKHDDVNEFWADFAQPHQHANIDFVLHPFSSSARVEIYHYKTYARVLVTFPTRAGVELMMNHFDTAAPTSVALPDAEVQSAAPRVFIGHGGSSQAWRSLKDHLVDQHQFDVVAYETGARAGHTIRDVLEEMLAESSFALLVMTAEDVQADGEFRARQNVVHETGLFQGRLGFARAVILLEEGVENLSNLDGIQYIPFSRGNIREAFGDVLATLRREFGAR